MISTRYPGWRSLISSAMAVRENGSSARKGCSTDAADIACLLGDGAENIIVGSTARGCRLRPVSPGRDRAPRAAAGARGPRALS
ncbi:hypothetical protein GCM10018787_15740 [Streptomyces thermodiastaticus]|nr:hypothetical protein GCM10018787_15740 [Streptomyces thermodiastaticus]